MKFDAYAASIQSGSSSFLAVAECLGDALKTAPSVGPSVRRFGPTTAFNVGPRMAAWMGVMEQSGLIYVEAKGETTPTVVAALRSAFPSHGVPRVDVCEDYNEPGALDRLIAIARAHKGPRVKSGYVALPDDDEDGRTWAAGKRGGTGYMRLYDKGKQKEYLHLGQPDWARFEVELRPHYSADKQAASLMSPVEVLSLCPWARSVAEAVLRCDISKYQQQIRRYSHDKTTLYIARTFRRHLQEMIENGEAIDRTFQQVWEEDDAWASINRH